MSELDDALAALWQEGDIEGVSTAAIEAWGGEVYGFLVATLRSETAADDVFSQTCEDLWRGLPAFQWRCRLRTWMYTLARHAASRHRRAPANRPSRRVPLSQADGVVQAVRSRTAEYLRSDVKDRFAEIRAALDPDDQALLILRVDRQLPWSDIARILADEPLTDDAIRRDAARLRKRFQRVKNDVRERAIEAGLMEAR